VSGKEIVMLTVIGIVTGRQVLEKAEEEATATKTGIASAATVVTETETVAIDVIQVALAGRITGNPRRGEMGSVAVAHVLVPRGQGLVVAQPLLNAAVVVLARAPGHALLVPGRLVLAHGMECVTVGEKLRILLQDRSEAQ